MQVILLCAGQSSRMKPMSDKVLLEFCGKTLLEHQIHTISSAKIFDFVIVGNKNNLSKIQEICKKIQKEKNNFTFEFTEQENQANGMKGALEVCKKFIKKSALVVNSNDIVEKDVFFKIKELSQKNTYKGIICGKLVKSYFPGGYLSINNNNELLDIVEKPKEGTEPSNLINLVIHYFQNFHEFLNIVENLSNSTDDAYEKALKIYSQNEKCFVYKYDGFWQAIKYPWHILDVQNYFLSQQKEFISPNANIANSATIKGKNIVIEDNVKIFENAVIVGPCYIGKNTVIANNSLVRDSIIGPGCIVGFQTEIARSFLRKKIWTHSNYIGDSIIDENVSFGAGTVTGNLRLDEKEISIEIKKEKINTHKTKMGTIIGSGVRIGVQCSMNPGIKIGEKSFISSGVILTKNVDKQKFIYAKQELVEKDNLSEVSVEKRSF